MRAPPQPRTAAVLLIVREPLRTDQKDAYVAIEDEIARDCVELGCDHTHAALEPLDGPYEVWWLNAFSSDDDRRRVERSFADNRPLMAALERSRQRKLAAFGAMIETLTRFRPDLSTAEPWSLAGARFLAVAVTRDVPGVRLKPDTTGAGVRLKPDTTGAGVRLKPDTTGAAVRLKPDTTGAPGPAEAGHYTDQAPAGAWVFEAASGERYILKPARSSEEAEVFARTLASGARVLAVQPRWGLPTREWIEADPEFWRPNPLVAAAPHRDSGAPGTWTVWRQDDSGNRFLISSGHSRDEAEHIVREFESRGHKQTYWVSPAV